MGLKTIVSVKEFALWLFTDFFYPSYPLFWVLHCERSCSFLVAGSSPVWLMLL